MPVPCFDYYLSRTSRERMIKEISQIYEIIVNKRIKDKNNRDYKETNKYKYKLLSLPIYEQYLKGIYNENITFELGKKIVEEFDNEYAKLDIIDKYYDLANKLSDTFDKLKDFPILFKQDIWYDIHIHKNINNF